jgi:4-hydroxythreonine-4-phosphate dehydrogenase
MKPLIAITMGDPGGIGPEIILKSLKKARPKNAQLLIIGSLQVFKNAAKRLNFSLLQAPPNNVRLKSLGPLRLLDIEDEARKRFKKCFPKKSIQSKKTVFGKVSAWNACLAYTSLEYAAHLAREKVVQGLVTAPIHKQAIRLIDPKFVGHTEFLARSEKVEDFAMMFVSKRLKVTLATIHIPLREVPAKIHKRLVTEKIRLTNEFLKKHLKIKSPQIGVAALNPHGNEFGREEDRVLKPAVCKMQQKGICVRGPLPGDQIFYEAFHGHFDAVISMYHDQGLAPFKMIAFQDGVNVTLGLPYLRTSPDHGTAFDIAGKNKAFPDALVNSICLVDSCL